MFINNTVFILGAGASWHYGYPTGEALVEKIIQKATIVARYLEHSLRVNHTERPVYIVEDHKPDADLQTQWQLALKNCQKLKAGLEQVNPLVIDYYLGWNPDLQKLGRLLIAWVILECEDAAQEKGRNINRRQGEYRDDWVRFVIHQIAINCKKSSDLLGNRVSFVTFNYDLSLEASLHKGLSHIQMFAESDVSKFLSGSRIVHMYGKIREVLHANSKLDWLLQGQDPKQFNEFSMGDFHMKFKILLDAVYSASKGLRVIDPDDKGSNDTDLTIARTVIADAQRIFILGYGFDENNSERLNLREFLGHSGERADRPIAFTNFQDINQINKRASKLFYGHPRNFSPNGPAIVDRYEKSVRNTYDALAFDFDLAE
jgi:hypothetical protein